MTPPVLAFAADHGGFALKGLLLAFAKDQGWPTLDLGTHSEERCDSMDFAVLMARALKEERAQRGVLICKSGNGIAMVANRFAHLRVAVVHNGTTARLAREHNDANVISFGAHIIGQEVALECVKIFYTTKFLEGRYAERRDRFSSLGGL